MTSSEREDLTFFFLLRAIKPGITEEKEVEYNMRRVLVGGTWQSAWARKDGTYFFLSFFPSSPLSLSEPPGLKA